MRNNLLIIILILFSFFFGEAWGGASSFAQVAYAPDMMKDDPIVAALDSLYKLDLFEMGYAKVNYPINPKYNFALDSVPHYDDMVYEARIAKLDALSPFDLQYNTYVQDYINLYIFNRREQVSRMMALSQLYFPMFEQMLDKYNLPLELKYLAMCESALNPLAKSRSGAMGLWQFMYPTGKIFRLKVSSYVDDRCDPYKSTIAACEYFQYLFGMFGNWEMVLAAYNAGPGTINKAIRRSGGKKTYWGIRPFLPKETQGYVPAFIAVNYVMNYTSEHNIHSAIPKKTFLEVDTVSVKKQISFEQLSTLLNIPEDELQYLNPGYRKRVIPVSPDEPSFVTLPSNKIGAFINNEAIIYNSMKRDTLSLENVVMQETTLIHTIKQGEHLSNIAAKYGCSVSDIKTWNKITSNTVKPGKKLTIITWVKKPIGKTVASKSGSDSTIVTKLTENTEIKIPDDDEFLYYIIKNGDSFAKIATLHNTTVDEIKRLNNFPPDYHLEPGKVIKVEEL